MGVYDREYMRRNEELPGPGAKRVSKWIWVGLAVLVVGVIAVAVSTPQKSPPMTEGSRLVNINTATARELETLPGIGPTLAELVIAGRPYADVADLARVRGIGERQVERLRPMLTVSEPTRVLAPPSSADRTTSGVKRETASTLIAYGIVAIGGVLLLWPWVKGMLLRWRNRRTVAAFEDAERKRWEGHKRK